jgi:hypothetical protein
MRYCERAFGPLQFMKRITRLVRINHPFRIANRNWTYPAGEYEITTEEEVGGSVPRHLKTIIYIPKSKGPTGIGEFVEIAPEELDSIIQFQPYRKQGL